MQSRIVVALGGNALGETAEEQLKLLREAAKSLVSLIYEGNQLLIVHGNGPQVGMINTGLNFAYESGAIHTDMPLTECVALSQGYIGYHLQNAVQAELMNRNIEKKAATIITQVVVDPKDPAFKNPTKPIGRFYSKDESEALIKEKKYFMIEDSSRGYRRVVPSPAPIDIVEKDIIISMLKTGHIVIAAGGGGIPVIEKEGIYEGIPAVVDKDLAAEKLAECIDADYLIILTAVDNVSLNYGKPNQCALGEVTAKKLFEYKNQGHFAEGSMLPKVNAAIKFVNSRKDRVAVITSLKKANEAVKRKVGTIIV